MSTRYLLTEQELNDLEFEHRHASDKRYADRVKAVCLLGKGWARMKIAEALLIDRETVRNHFKRYRNAGFLSALQKNEAGGSHAALTEEEHKGWINISVSIFTSRPKKLHITLSRHGRLPTVKVA